MQNLLNFLKSRLFVNIILVILVLGAAGGLFYYQTRVFDTCEKKLESLGQNHLCISTNKGLMVFELYPDAGPEAVKRITNLDNNEKFYDGLEFYRVSKDFVIQGGVQDLNAKINSSTVNDSATQKKIELLGKEPFAVETNFDKLGISEADKADLIEQGYVSTAEINPRKFEYGSLAFANNGAKGNSTEIFIVSSKDAENENVTALNGKYTNFGKIIEGQNILDEINNSKINLDYPIEISQDQSKPAEIVKIYEVRVK